MLFRILFAAILCVHTLGQFLPFPDGGPKEMTLTPGDLKVFSGHALNILQVKCPKVNASTIFELNKFIGKAIAKEADPVPGDDSVFRGVIDSMTSCEKGETIEAPKQKRENVGVKNVESDEIPEIFLFGPADGEVTELLPESDEKIFGEIKAEEKKSEAKPADAKVTLLNPAPAPAPAIEAKKSVAPAPASEAKKPAAPKATAAGPKPESKKNPLIVWISSVMSSVQDFFRDIFGDRRRRETPEPITAPRNGIFHRRAAEDPTGKGSFTRLFTEVCRLYCEKCNGPTQAIGEFKMAATQLLEHLVKIVPIQGLDLAAKHHITNEFMKVVEECE